MRDSKSLLRKYPLEGILSYHPDKYPLRGAIIRFLFPPVCRVFWGLRIALAFCQWAWGGEIYGPLLHGERATGRVTSESDSGGTTVGNGCLTLASEGAGTLALAGQNTFNGLTINADAHSSPFGSTGLRAAIPYGPRPKGENTGKTTGTGGGFLQLEDSGTGGTTISPGTLQGGGLTQVGLGEGTGTLVLSNTNFYGTLTLNPNYASISQLTGGDLLAVGSVPTLSLSANPGSGNLVPSTVFSGTVHFVSSPSLSDGTSLHPWSR